MKGTGSRGAPRPLHGPRPAPTLRGVHFGLLLSSLLLELHVAKVHDAPGQLIHADLLLGAEAQHVKSHLQGHSGEKAQMPLASCSTEWRPPWSGTGHGVDPGGQTHPDQREVCFPPRSPDQRLCKGVLVFI